MYILKNDVVHFISQVCYNFFYHFGSTIRDVCISKTYKLLIHHKIPSECCNSYSPCDEDSILTTPSCFPSILAALLLTKETFSVYLAPTKPLIMPV